MAFTGAVGLAGAEQAFAAPVASKDLAPGDTSNGADNFYTSDQVVVKRISFKNKYEMRVVGNLFVPNNLNRGTMHPALVVGHPMGAVKEQSANLYATKMAEQGYVTLSFDLSFWGESAGKPGNSVLPDIYAEDFSAAVDYLRAQAFVDKEAWGRSGSAAAAAS